MCVGGIVGGRVRFFKKKSIDGVLGIRTRGRRMVGADETTELWLFGLHFSQSKNSRLLNLHFQVHHKHTVMLYLIVSFLEFNKGLITF